MVAIKSFEVRVKLLPLIARDVQIKRFVVESPQVYLVRTPDGRANWEGFGGKPAEAVKKEKKKQEDEQKAGGSPTLPVEQIIVGEFSVSNGALVYEDQKAGTKKAISDLNLLLTDVSLDRPLTVRLSANADGKPVALEGRVGPIGRTPGKGPLNIDLVVRAIDHLKMGIKGQVNDAASDPSFEMVLNLAPFSPRRLFERMDQEFPVKTKDPAVLENVALKVNLQGNPSAVSLGGTLAPASLLLAGSLLIALHALHCPFGFLNGFLSLGCLLFGGIFISGPLGLGFPVSFPLDSIAFELSNDLIVLSHPFAVGPFVVRFLRNLSDDLYAFRRRLIRKVPYAVFVDPFIGLGDRRGKQGQPYY